MWGPSIRNVNKIKWKLLTGRGQLGIYLISLSRTSDQLDIFHCALLKQKYFDKKALQVVGIAEGQGGSDFSCAADAAGYDGRRNGSGYQGISAKDLYLRERRRRMTVLLTILKVIGWILLGILGLILLTVLTVLLVPIRYRADGVWKEEKYIRGRVTWLLHLLSIRVTYEKNCFLEVRVAGFLIYPKKERSGKKEKSGIRGGCRGRCRRRRRGYECAGCGRSENAVCGRKNAGRERACCRYD